MTSSDAASSDINPSFINTKSAKYKKYKYNTKMVDERINCGFAKDHEDSQISVDFLNTHNDSIVLFPEYKSKPGYIWGKPLFEERLTEVD